MAESRVKMVATEGDTTVTLTDVKDSVTGSFLRFQEQPAGRLLEVSGLFEMPGIAGGDKPDGDGTQITFQVSALDLLSWFAEVRPELLEEALQRAKGSRIVAVNPQTFTTVTDVSEPVTGQNVVLFEMPGIALLQCFAEGSTKPAFSIPLRELISWLAEIRPRYLEVEIEKARQWLFYAIPNSEHVAPDAYMWHKLDEVADAWNPQDFADFFALMPKPSRQKRRRIWDLLRGLFQNDTETDEAAVKEYEQSLRAFLYFRNWIKKNARAAARKGNVFYFGSE